MIEVLNPHTQNKSKVSLKKAFKMYEDFFEIFHYIDRFLFNLDEFEDYLIENKRLTLNDLDGDIIVLFKY